MLVSVVGCASHPKGGNDGNDGNGTVDYRRSSEIGAATAHVDADGAFTRTNRDGSTETGQLSAAALDDLQSEVDQAEFATLEKQYGCGGCADHPVNTITVHVDDAEYKVQAEDDSGYPARLQPLIDRLQALLQEPLP